LGTAHIVDLTFVEWYGHTSRIPEHDPSILLARRAEQLWVSCVPRDVVDIIAMRAGE
jgi:hypothetical protein